MRRESLFVASTTSFAKVRRIDSGFVLSNLARTGRDRANRVASHAGSDTGWRGVWATNRA